MPYPSISDLLEHYGFLLLLGAAVIVVVLSFVFGQKRVRFTLLDYCYLTLPFLSWSAGFLANGSKSLANPPIEFVIVAALISVALVVRLAIATKLNERAVAITLLTGLVAASFLLGRFLHALPE